MKILLINRFFWPDESATAMLSADLAEDLVKAGHEVHVLCSRLRYDRPDAPLPKRETWNGVFIHRLPSANFGRSSVWRRMADLGTFQLSLHLLGPWICKPDVILVLTDPPMAMSAAFCVRLFRGGKIIHYAMDIYPDVGIALGTFRSSSILTRLLARLATHWLRRCDLIPALGETMAERLKNKGMNPNRIAVVPPWADGIQITPLPHEQNRFRRELGYSADDVVVMYSGNMGRAHDFETICQGMIELRDNPRLHFCFIGGGAKLDEIKSVIEKFSIARARILPYQPRERLRETLGAADIHLISQARGTAGLIVPSKLAPILAAGRSAIFIGEPECEIARCFEKEKCGRAIQLGDVAGFARSIRDLAVSKETRDALGIRAREVFERDYARGILTRRLISLVAKI